MGKPVVLSLGMGIDSAAILARWLTDPSSRDFALDDLVVITAMVGSEYRATERLMTTYLAAADACAPGALRAGGPAAAAAAHAQGRAGLRGARRLAAADPDGDARTDHVAR
jgi:hypothetical protein